MDGIKKALNLIMLITGMGIFSIIVLMKVELFAQQSHAQFKLLSAQHDWDDYMYGKTLKETSKK